MFVSCWLSSRCNRIYLISPGAADQREAADAGAEQIDHGGHANSTIGAQTSGQLERPANDADDDEDENS